MINTRLFDVFLLGPLDIVISKYIENVYLKIFMIYTGVTNILFNGYNYLYLEKKIFKKQDNWFLNLIIDDEHGKTQPHRLYNLLIMYPIMFYIYKKIKLPKILSILLVTKIIIGFIYNFYYLIDIF